MRKEQLLLDYLCWWVGFVVIIFALNICAAYWPVTTIFGILLWLMIEFAIPRVDDSDRT